MEPLRSESHEQQDLLDLAKAGRGSALGHLLERQRGWVLNLLKVQMGGVVGKKERPSDMYQEGMLQAVDGFPNCRAENLPAFRAWLRDIVLTRLLEHVRYWTRRKRDPRFEVAQSSSFGAGLMASGASDEQKERQQLLTLVLPFLPEQDKLVVILHAYEGKSYQEIAAQLGLSCVTVRQRYSRAITRLAEGLKLLSRMDDLGWTPRAQEVALLKKLQSLKADAIATHLNMPLNAVKQWLVQLEKLLAENEKDQQ